MAHTEVVVSYNSSTGSNTNPSDCVDSSVATSVTAQGTASGTTITFDFSGAELESLDLSGAADDDSDYIWCSTTNGGRHLFQITAFSPSAGACTSITVYPAIEADFTGATWHVNGTRQSFEADTDNSDFEDMDRGWTFELDGNFTHNTRWLRIGNNASSASAVDDAAFTIRAASGASSRPSIDVAQNRELLRWGSNFIVKVSGIKLTCSTGGGGNSNIYIGGGSLTMEDCVVTAPGGSATAMLDAGSGDSIALHNCYFSGGSTYTLTDDNGSYFTISNCVIDCADTYGTTAAVHLSASNCNTLVDTLVVESAGIGVQIDVSGNTGRQSMWMLKNVTVVDCAGDGFELSGTPNSTSNPSWSVNIVNCLSVNNGGYGFDLDDTNLHGEAGYRDYNCAFNNTSGSYNGMAAGANDITITADPFTDAANDDYTLNANASGGALLQNAALHQLPEGT